MLVAIAFSGAASATTELEMESDYQDSSGNDIDNADPGEVVQYTAETENEGDENADDVTVSINIDSDIEWDNSQFTYSTSYDDGKTWNQFDDNVTSTEEGYDWDVGTLVTDQEVIFKAAGMFPVSKRRETTTATVYEKGIAHNKSTSTLEVTETNPMTTNAVSTKTVPMQETGPPVTLMVLAMAILSTGLVYSRKYKKN